jgi:hypothetical protein
MQEVSRDAALNHRREFGAAVLPDRMNEVFGERNGAPCTVQRARPAFRAAIPHRDQAAQPLTITIDPGA